MLSFLMVYGVRVTDLVNLNILDINFVHDCFSFRQSKTENLTIWQNVPFWCLEHCIFKVDEFC